MSINKSEKCNIWQYLFTPGSVAVVGASNTRGSWGFNITKGLLFNSVRRIYAVNPKAPEVLGLKAFPSVSDIPEPVDLAVIVVSPPQVPGVLRECVAKGVKMVEVITAGFSEMNEEGRKLESELVEIAAQSGIHFVGPNAMGHADTISQISTFGQPGKLASGPVALISQSGSMSLNIVFSAAEYGIAFSKYISTGNEANLIMEDYLEYLAQDDSVKIITAYIEGLRDGRRFFQLAREITQKKPMVVIKVGGTEEAARAVMSHTGALAGSDPVYTAAFKQAGVIRVDDDEELCDVVYALLNSPLPRGNRVGILSIGGGPGALTAEGCEKEGLVLSPLSSNTVTKLDSCLPVRWSRRNPIDMAGISASEYPMIAASLFAVLDDENMDAVFLQAPIIASREQLINRMSLNPEEIKAYREKDKGNLLAISQKIMETGKPLVMLGQMRGIRSDPDVASIFRNQKILTYPNARRAARVLRHLAWYRNYINTSRGQ